MSNLATLAVSSVDDVAYLATRDSDYAPGEGVQTAAMLGQLAGMGLGMYGSGWSTKQLGGGFAGPPEDILARRGLAPGRFASRKRSGFLGLWGESVGRVQAERRFSDTSLKIFRNVYKRTLPTFVASGRGFFGARGMALGLASKTFMNYTSGQGVKMLAARAGTALITASNVAFLAPLALDLGRGLASGLAYLGADRSRLDFGSSLIDTQQAWTQRQAGLMAIHNSQLQTRSMFMREAEAYHR